MDEIEKYLIEQIKICGNDMTMEGEKHAFECTLQKVNEQQLSIQGVVESAYLLKVEGQGQVLIVAENIDDAMDKLEAKGIKNYAFIRSASLDFI